ncbi:MAG: lamin tail domain-containing protein, partial [Thermoplasmata archaeon]
MRPSNAIAAILLLLTVIPTPSAYAESPASPVLIYGVHPGGACDWEHVLIGNPGDAPVDVSGWFLSDDEGFMTIPEGTLLSPGERVWVGVNSTAFRVLWGRDLDVIGDRVGGFGLADRGDGLLLMDGDAEVVDQVAYGSPGGDAPEGWSGRPVRTSTTMPWGRLLLRSAGGDTDTAADWDDLREPRCGWDLEGRAPNAVSANATCFVTPEEGWRVMAGTIMAARSDLAIALYDLTSMDLTSLVARKAREGVRTRLLLEASPVGLTEDERERRKALLSTLEADGVEVWLTRSTVKGESHRPYRYHHEKYCVIDGRRVVITTENWCISSFPQRPLAEHGSRGWGALVRSQTLARDLLDVFERDLVVSAHPFEPTDGYPLDLPSLPAPAHAKPTPLPCEAMIMVGPEAWGHDLEGLLGLLDGARKSMLLELAYLDVWWGETLSPVVERLLLAASRGVDVRLLLDPGQDGDGRSTLEEVHVLAASRGVTNLRGVVAKDITGVGRVHAKGLVIDGETSVLGSLNWAWSSMARNREVLVVIQGPDAVRVLADAFWSDWNASIAGVPPAPPRHMLLEAALRWE